MDSREERRNHLTVRQNTRGYYALACSDSSNYSGFAVVATDSDTLVNVTEKQRELLSEILRIELEKG